MSTTNEVSIHLTDTDFTSRCALQDCFVIPHVTPNASEVEAPRAFLTSPFMLHSPHAPLPCHLRPLTLLWRCGGCGREQSVASEVLSHTQSNRTGKASRQKSHRRHSPPPTRADPSVCRDCYPCPRCNAPAIGVHLTRQLEYTASCAYCHWRSDVRGAELSDLLAALEKQTVSRRLAIYERKLGEWSRATAERWREEEEHTLSVSRLANARYTPNTNNTKHVALILEEVRDQIRAEREKASIKQTLMEKGEMRFPAGSEGNPAREQTKREEEEKNVEKAEEKHCIHLGGMCVSSSSISSVSLTQQTQLAQNGFFVPDTHPIWRDAEGDSSTLFLKPNNRLPLVTVLLDFDDKTRSTMPVSVNGIHLDPSFPQIQQDLSIGRHRRQWMTLQLAAAIRIPVLRHIGPSHASDGAEQQRFAWHNIGEDDMILRRLVISREVGGTFSASITITDGAGEEAWQRLRSGEVVEFTLTLCRNTNGHIGGRVMVGLLLEVCTVLPLWDDASGPKGMDEWEYLLQAASQETCAAEESIKEVKREHIVEYGQTIVW